MQGITEKYVGRGIYETWPTGATRAIETVENKVVEACKAITLSTEIINALISKFKLEKLNEPDEDVQTKRLWKTVEEQLLYNANTIMRLTK